MGLKRDVGLPPHLFHSNFQAGNFGYLPFILSSNLSTHKMKNTVKQGITTYEQFHK